MYVLLKASVDYADEFDCRPFAVMSATAWAALKQRAIEFTGALESCFGTNEELQFDDGQAWLRSIKVLELSEEEAILLEKLFSSSKSGSLHGKLSGAIYFTYGTGDSMFSCLDRE
jgi:hypothetical protein